MDQELKETDPTQKCLDFYLDLVENNTSKAEYYLAENVVLDWFGRTIKDHKKVSSFIKDQVCKVTHHITKSFPSEDVAFKEIHHVTVPLSDEDILAIRSPTEQDLTTPPKKIEPSTSTIEMGQGDGIHNCLMSPPKKMKLGLDDGENEILESESCESDQLKYLTAEGTVEFHRPSITKKLQTESRWKRPVKLHIGYTNTSFTDCTIYLIIYEGNLKCRRNLFKDFCESDSDTKNSV